MSIRPVMPTWNIGALIAIVVLVICIVLLILDRELTATLGFCLIGALAVARLT